LACEDGVESRSVSARTVRKSSEQNPERTPILRSEDTAGVQFDIDATLMVKRLFWDETLEVEFSFRSGRHVRDQSSSLSCIHVPVQLTLGDSHAFNYSFRSKL
jgi:hypothetical protein